MLCHQKLNDKSMQQRVQFTHIVYKKICFYYYFLLFMVITNLEYLTTKWTIGEKKTFIEFNQCSK